MKVLIVNADDLGLSPSVNRGIVEAHSRGLVTSASVIVNLPAFEDAVERLRSFPALGVGVHLNLTCGPPVGTKSRSSSLVGPAGRFPSLRGLIARLALRSFQDSDVEQELCAQIERALGAGLTVLHLDSHHNVHLHPRIRGCVERVAERYGIRWVRFRAQRPVLARGLGDRGLARLRNRLRHGLALWACRGGRGPASGGTRAIIGAPHVDVPSFRRALVAMIGEVSEGVTELVCHPGYADAELRRWDPQTGDREEEQRVLCDGALRELVESRGIRLAHYGDLA